MLLPAVAVSCVAQAFGIHRSLAQALALQDQARFEPHPPLVRSTLLRLTASMEEVFQEALDAGRLQWAPSVQAMPATVCTPLGELALAVSRRLDALADCLQKGVLELEPAAALEDLLHRVRAAGAQGARSADFDAYLVLSRRLLLAVSRLDEVLRSCPGLLANTGAAFARLHPQAS
jgi:hypothetical protein